MTEITRDPYGNPMSGKVFRAKETQGIKALTESHRDLIEAIDVFINHRSHVLEAQMRGRLDSIPTGRIDEIVGRLETAADAARKLTGGGS